MGGALFSVGAVKGVEFGAGFAAAGLPGSENNDALYPPKAPGEPPVFGGNRAGGVLGGLSSGQALTINVAVKPIPSIAREQDTVSSQLQPVKLKMGGRHDVCAIPRIIPVLKAMLALSLADFILLRQSADVFR